MSRLFIHALLVLSLCVFLAGGCDRGDRTASGLDGKRTGRAEKVRVLATVYPLADIARQVGGERVSVEWFRESGQSPAALDATADNRQMLSRADLLVISGTEPPWIISAMDSPYQAQRLIRLDRLPSSGLLNDPADAPDEPHAPGQPYEWLLPELARELAVRISERLAVIEPENGSQFTANARALSAEIEQLFQDTAPSGGGGFATTDPGFNPLAALLGRVPLLHGPAMPLPLSAQDLARVQDVLQARRIRTLYIPADTSPAVARDLASRLNQGILIKRLDAFGSSAARGRNTYTALLRYNLEQLSEPSATSAPSTAASTR